jgi:hypothetical protein
MAWKDEKMAMIELAVTSYHISVDAYENHNTSHET